MSQSLFLCSTPYLGIGGEGSYSSLNWTEIATIFPDSCLSHYIQDSLTVVILLCSGVRDSSVNTSGHPVSTISELNQQLRAIGRTTEPFLSSPG